MRVYLRPNGPYLAFLLAGLVAAGCGVSQILDASELMMRVLGGVVMVSGATLLVLFGYPVVASTVLRVPVLAIENGQVRLPLMGLVLDSAEITWIVESHRTAGSRQSPILLIRVTDPAAVISRIRPWLRNETQRNLQLYGAPLVLQGESLDLPLDEIAAGLRAYLAARRSAA
ncbi:MAG: hypothetical protein HOV76_00655 [Hamadaea sp.]|nr:hypothetical protein [Hamadaea sp.]